MMIRHLRGALWASCLVAVVCCGGVFAAYSVDFAPADLGTEVRDGGVQVTLPGCEPIGAIGLPDLPARGLAVAIPAECDVAALTVVRADFVDLPGHYDVAVCEEPLPTGAQPVGTRTPAARGFGVYPGKVVEFLGCGWLSGHHLAAVRVYPVEYNTDTGALRLYTHIEFDLDFVPAAGGPEIAVRSESAELRIADAVRNLVINPDEVEETAAELVGPAPMGGTVEYLIITDANLVGAFERLAAWKTAKGVPSEIVTTSWVYANYSGRDNQEKIRNCIKDYYANKGLIWVLLGGDVSKVPCRGAFAMQGNLGDWLPCDLYFADLDGDWNADGDGRWGEYPSDNVDMYADVYVGRASVETTSEANTFIDKALQYEGEASMPQLPLDYELRVLMLASYLDWVTDEGILMDQIDTESIPARFAVTKLYERFGNLSPQAAVQELTKGQNLVAHAGHGQTDSIQCGSEYLYMDQLYGLTNRPRYTALFTSLSCFSGQFDENDCLAEKFVLAPSGGGYYTGNSRYGWYWRGDPLNGLSGAVLREQFQALFLRGHEHLAEMHADGLAARVPAAKDSEYERFCMYEMNLLGEPELPMWINTPADLAVSHPASIPTGPYDVAVTVTSGGSGVPDARVCLWKGDEVYAVAMTNSAGKATVGVNAVTEGPMAITVTKNDFLPYQGEIEVVPGEYEIVHPHSYVIYKGEEITGGVGTVQASDDNWHVVKSIFSVRREIFDVLYTGTTTVLDPAALEVRYEAHMDRELPIILLLWNNDITEWEVVFRGWIGAVDETVVIPFTDNAAQYVDPVTGDMTLRVFLITPTRDNRPGYMYSDLVEWALLPK